MQASNIGVAQVWTYYGRVAFVVSVQEKGKPIADQLKLQRLRQIMLGIMGPKGGGIVNIKQVALLPVSQPLSTQCRLRCIVTTFWTIHYRYGLSSARTIHWGLIGRGVQQLRLSCFSLG
jgi:hypothetical protein